MKGMQNRCLLAAVSVLFTSCLARHETVTITSATIQTVTTTANVIQTVTITSEIVPDVTPAPQIITVTQPPSTTTALVTPIPQVVSTLPPPVSVSLPASAIPVSGSQGEVILTIALQQAALANIANAIGENGPQGVITIAQGNTATAPPATVSPGSTSGPATTAGSSILGPQTATVQEMPQVPMDPAQGGFPGGNPPNTTVDLPLTIVFLLMYISGAVTHISIYRANAKRGHKFLLSDLMFDFCMVRTLTCLFRIIWVFVQARGVVLAAQIFFNGGAAVIFAVNIFLVQRIVRSMHPTFGWSKPFSIITRVMAISVPIIIVSQIVSIIVVFFSVGDETRLSAFEGLLKFGASYNLFLVTFPFWSIFLACAIPGPKPEKFGVGNLRVKTSLVMLASILLTTGAIVRTYSFFNPRPIDTDDVLYGKPVFYTTQFMMEIFVVAGYALLRFDLLFHIPNGSFGPGDYSMPMKADSEKAQVFTRGDIEDRIASCGIPHQVLEASYSKRTVETRADQPIYAVFFPQSSDVERPQEAEEGAELPPRPPRRVSRRDSVMEYVQQRQSRGSRVFKPSYGGFDAEEVPPVPQTPTAEGWNVAPQFKFTRPRKPPFPPE